MQTLEIAMAELVGLHQNVLTLDFILLALRSQRDGEAMKIPENLLSNPAEPAEPIKERVLGHYQRATPCPGQPDRGLAGADGTLLPRLRGGQATRQQLHLHRRLAGRPEG